MARLTCIDSARTRALVKRPLLHCAATRVLALLSAALLSACGGGSGEGIATVYEARLDAAQAPTWLTDPQRDAAKCEPLPTLVEPSGDRYAVSSAPWWIDPNHAAPGAGYLHLVAFAYHHDWSSDGEITVPSPGRPMDLRNATVHLRYRAPTLRLPPSAKLYLWFQTKISSAAAPEGRVYVNYLLDSRPLPVGTAASGWLDVTLRLPTDDSQYRCLGSSASRTDRYGCAASVADALRDWNIDLGFVIVFPDEGAAEQISGSVEFQRVSIDLPFANLLTHENAPADLIRGASTCRL